MTYTLKGKVVRSGRIFETTVYAQTFGEALRIFQRNHRRSVVLGIVKVSA